MPSPPSSLFDLSGKTALVTGAGRGLGWEIARALSVEGAAVYINGRDGAALSKKISSDGPPEGKMSAAPFDVCDDGAVDDWMTSTGSVIDILINNVGLRHRHTLQNCPPDDFAHLLDANLVAPYRLARLAAGSMQEGASIINITSIAGPRARAGDAAYTAAKGGLEALTRALAMELAPKGVRVNAIAPGFFATEANKEMVNDPAIQAFVNSRIPLKRWGRPDEIAGAAVFLSSDAASYVNGHVLTVDAGLSISF
jgi:gluconate 5-dehydrogenase